MNNTIKSDSINVPAWVLLILFGVAIEFVGRLIGYENDPFFGYHAWTAQLTLTLAALLVIFGYFTFLSGSKRRSTSRRRHGMLLITMGAVMLVTSFIFKLAMPMLFG